MTKLKISSLNPLKYLVVICFLFPVILFGQIEICDNGIDDDGDSLIDLNDADCICEIIEPISLIPNPSFEDLNCCPTGRSQLDCAENWIQASRPTTDFIHTCNWLGWDQFPPPQPFPDGDGIMGFRDGRVRNAELEAQWKEYAGACLLSPLEANTVYKFQFDVGFVNAASSPPINISFFGSASCDNLPFGNGEETFGCPSNSPDWEKLAEVLVSGGFGRNWVNAEIEITPDFDINTIAIGPDCPAVIATQSTYYFFDNLLLSDLASFSLLVNTTNHPCSSDFRLSVPNNPTFDYQWYLDGVAISGEVSSEISQIYGEGFYQVSIVDGISCRVSPGFDYTIPVINTPLLITMCEGESYQLGDLEITEAGFYIDTLQNFNGCDSIVGLELEIIGQNMETVEALFLEGEAFEFEGQTFTTAGEFPVTVTSDLGCDDIILLELSSFHVFIPNVFSPNQDGFNDIFRPFAPPGEIANVEITIYDRWGSQLHKGPDWQAREAEMGIYVYVMEIDFTYGLSKTFYGDIAVVR